MSSSQKTNSTKPKISKNRGNRVTSLQADVARARGRRAPTDSSSAYLADPSPPELLIRVETGFGDALALVGRDVDVRG